MGKPGATPGNMNRLRTGRRVPKNRLVVGELPRQLIAVRTEGRTYRRALEAAVLAVRDEISVLDSHHIDSATAGTMHAALARWVLRHRFDKLKAADILAAGREILRAKQARDAAVRQLGLDVPPEPVDLARYLELKRAAVKPEEEPTDV